MKIIKPPVFIMLCGVSGSGKTTFANTLEQQGFLSFSTDAYVEVMASELGKTYSDVWSQTINHAQKRVEADVSMASMCLHDIVWDQTNLTANSRRRKLNVLENKNRYVKYAIYFETDKDVIQKRLTERNSSGKVITDKILQQQYKDYQKPVLSEGFDYVLSPEGFYITQP